MRKILTLIAGTLVCASIAFAVEEKVALDKVPKAVADGVKNRFKEAKVTDSAKEEEGGKVVYEVTVDDKGQHIDVTLTPEGNILMIEKTIKSAGLPKSVTQTLDSKYPKATQKIVEEIFKVDGKQEKLAYYELLLIKADKHAVEVQIDADGKVLLEENKDDEVNGKEDEKENGKEKEKANGKEKAK